MPWRSQPIGAGPRTIIRVGLLALALLALVAAGCGGGSDETEPVARYLETVEAEQQRFVEIRTRIGEALFDVDADRPDDAWVEAAESLLREGIEYSTAASDLEAIAPPPGLEDAHGRLVKSLETSSKMTTEFAANLRAMDIEQLAALTNVMSRRGLTVRRDRTRWRTAVIAAAIEAGVEVPAWVDEVGDSA